MENGEEGRGTAKPPSSDRECFLCRFSPGILLRSMRKVDEGAVAGGPSTSEGSSTSDRDCFTCRVTGAVTFAACSAYLANEYTKVPQVKTTHRAALAGTAGFFAAMSFWRAFM
eukprot:9239347-Pyramimonas_sp.AAC.3